MTKENKIYPNSPLQEAVFEIRFSGEPAISSKADEFYEIIRKHYPNVLVPLNSQSPLELYRFENDDNSSGVIVGIDKVAYFSKNYPGYESFKNASLEIIESFGKKFKLSNLKRTGLRYINVIPFTRKNMIIPIEEYLNIDIVLPQKQSNHFSNLSMVFTLETKLKGGLTTRIGTLLSPNVQQEAILLDFDYAKKEQGLIFSKIEEYIEESHTNTKAFFEDLITKNYRMFMEGKVV